MLVTDDGSHVQAKWIKVVHEKMTAWEGWIYCDPLMCDIFPEGPENPQFWYDKPDNSVKKITEPITRPPAQSKEAWFEWWHSHFRKLHSAQSYINFPGNSAQSIALYQMSHDSNSRPSALIDVTGREVQELDCQSLSVMSADANTPVTTTANRITVLCPIIAMTGMPNWRAGEREAFRINPNGGIEALDVRSYGK